MNPNIEDLLNSKSIFDSSNIDKDFIEEILDKTNNNEIQWNRIDTCWREYANGNINNTKFGSKIYNYINDIINLSDIIFYAKIDESNEINYITLNKNNILYEKKSIMLFSSVSIQFNEYYIYNLTAVVTKEIYDTQNQFIDSKYNILTEQTDADAFNVFKTVCQCTNNKNLIYIKLSDINSSMGIKYDINNFFGKEIFKYENAEYHYLKNNKQKTSSKNKVKDNSSNNDNGNIHNEGGSKMKKIAGLLVLIVFILAIGSGCFTIIDTGERGVVLRLGEFKYVMNEGFNFKLPFVDRVIKMSVRDVTYNAKHEVSSKDMQTVQVETTLIYTLEPDKLGNIYKTYGVNFENVLIKPTMSEIVNTIVAEYNIESFVEKRAEISKKISDSFILKIQNSGINVKSLLITNHDFSDEYNKAIEAKKVAEQGALKAKYDLEKTRLDAEAQTLKQKSLNEMVLQEKAIDKWDGKLPTYMGDGRNLPFLIKQ